MNAYWISEKYHISLRDQQAKLTGKKNLPNDLSPKFFNTEIKGYRKAAKKELKDKDLKATCVRKCQKIMQFIRITSGLATFYQSKTYKRLQLATIRR